MASQVGHLDPRQNQKAAVVDQQRKIGAACVITPSDPAVTWRHLPSPAGEQQTAQHILRPGACQVAQLRAVGNAIAQGMIALDILLKQTAADRIRDQLQGHWLVIGQTPLHQWLRVALRISLKAVRTARFGNSQFRQGRQTVALLELLQPLHALRTLQLPIGPAPVQ